MIAYIWTGCDHLLHVGSRHSTNILVIQAWGFSMAAGILSMASYVLSNATHVLSNAVHVLSMV